MASMLTVAAIVIILSTANVTVINAQQTTAQPQQPTVATQNGTATASSLFQSKEDSFRVRVPQGWAVHDMDNTGFALLTEVLQGYGLLAQICPEQQQQTVSNVGGSDNNSCQASQGDVIHIIRYPNLGPRLGFGPRDIVANSNGTLDKVLAYEIQKLQEVGYRNIQIVNSTYTTVNFDINAIPARGAPAKLVEMTYTTDSDPNEVKRGYFISTATDAAASNPGVITGYSIFYDGNSAAETAASGSLAPTTELAAVSQVFDSFELVVGEEAAQSAQPQQTQETTDETNNDNNNNDNDNNNNDNDNNNNDNDNNNNDNDNGSDCIVVGKPQSTARDNCDDTADADGDGGSNNDNSNNDNGSDCIVVGKPQSTARDNCDDTRD
jgi:hypothetical protein